jgi:hypothetical protein
MDYDDDKKKTLLNLGAWMGRHQAFALVANRCSAADAECLKAIRDSGDYKELGVKWEEFCPKYAGISRATADQHIQCFEQYGENYRRMAEVMSITPGTFKLIAGSVSDKGIEFEGEYIPIGRENGGRIAAAVKKLRVAAKARQQTHPPTPASLSKGLDKLIDGVMAIANDVTRRAELIVLLERAEVRFQELSRIMRESTVVVD